MLSEFVVKFSWDFKEISECVQTPISLENSRGFMSVLNPLFFCLKTGKTFFLEPGLIFDLEFFLLNLV